MRFLLAWVVVLALAVASTLLSFIGFWLRQAGGGLASEPPLADRLIWAGVIISGFVVFDFVRRASTPDDLSIRRAEFAWLVTASALMMIVFAGFAGVLVGTGGGPPAEADLRTLGTLSTYVVAGAALLSLVYVLRVEYWLWRNRRRQQEG